MEKLFLVTGASGKLGGAFVNKLKEVSAGKVYAFSRKSTNTCADKSYLVDLLEEKEVLSIFKDLDFHEYDEIILVHTVGKFKFEDGTTVTVDDDGDGIDDDVYRTNVITVKNILKSLFSCSAEETKIKVCAFASVSDKYNIPFWSSYTRSKNILRGYLQTLCEIRKISALVVNVSTVDTGNENQLRPLADKTYWLEPEEIVTEVLPSIENLVGYQEIDIIKENPSFKKDYYIDHDVLLKKWHTEMGLNNEGTSFDSHKGVG